MEDRQTAVEWLIEELVELDKQLDGRRNNEDATVFKTNPTKIYEQAKAMEKEQIGYTEEQVYQFWKAGQKYWETSGKSITFEELIEQYQNKTYN
jgi:hypothetical protein